MCIHYNILITQKHLNRSFLKWVRRRENLRIQITIIGFFPPNFLSVGRKQTLKEVPFLVRTARAHRHSPRRPRHHVVDRRPLEAVEGGRGGHGVSAHVFKEHPVADVHLGQATALDDAIEAVAGRSPYAG